MLGDDIAWALPQLRSQAESLMADTCTVTRAAAGQGAFNQSTGQYDTPARTTIYSGKCRLQIASVMGDAKSSDAGERDATVQGAVLQLPILGTDTISVDDVAEIVTAVNDASLEGRKYTVIGRHEKSQATARRLRVQAVTG